MIFAKLLASAGWCCPWSFFRANARVRTGLLAARLGVDDSTVRKWRRYYRQGQISCLGAPGCLRARRYSSPARR